MKTQPNPSDREVLAGLVERVTYQNAENGFCVLRVKARSHRDLVTVVGHAAAISAGEWVTATGDWVNGRLQIGMGGRLASESAEISSLTIRAFETRRTTIQICQCLQR